MKRRNFLLTLFALIATGMAAQHVLVLRLHGGGIRVLRAEEVQEIAFIDREKEDNVLISTAENPQAADFLKSVVYPDDNYHHSSISRFLPPAGTRGDHPLPIRLRAPHDARSAVRVRVYSTEGVTERVLWNKVSTGETLIRHLLPSRTYRVQWLDDNATPLSESSVSVEKGVRMIGLQQVLNVRDFGGWKAMNGRHVNYGLLYRGAQLHNPTDGQIATPSDIEELRRIGIRAELDLRGQQEAGGITTSPLGKDIRYYRIAGGGIYPYAEMIQRFPEDIKEVFHKVLENLRQGYPTYIHCAQGADRTGTIAFLLNGILGVSESDLAKDYELTSLSPVGVRSRVYYPEQKEMNYAALVRALDKFKGNTLLQRLEDYFQSTGITRAEIEEYRLFMLY